MEYILDRKEIYALKADGLLSQRLYVYFALRVEGYLGEMNNIDIPRFCQKWGITRNNFIKQLMSLSDKGAVQVDISELSLRAYTHRERIELAEQQLKSMSATNPPGRPIIYKP